IGPHCPGYVADLNVAEQLAEIGVVLMLFSVGLHFKLENLFKVKKIAIPGAILQTGIATFITILLTNSMGWSIQSGFILGLAIGVASTFVLARVLSDNNLLDTKQGHISIGWLIVEDIFTVVVLALLPLIVAYNESSQHSILSVFTSIIFILIKFTILCFFMFTLGYRAVTFILTKIAQSRSQELFTLTVVALIFLIATGSALVFGTSLALGAFIAGMIIAKTNVKHQAAANALSLKDIFTIIFFLSVGMLLNPIAIKENFTLFLGIMGVIIIAKPLSAFLLVLAFRYPMKVALTVSLALAQIGEFSFILAEQASMLELLPDAGYDIIVACALLSICINPLLFRCLGPFERLCHKIPFLKRIQKNEKHKEIPKSPEIKPKAIIIGYGPIGQDMTKVLKDLSYTPIIIEHNIDTVSTHLKDVQIIYGDASYQDLLKEADVEHAKLLIITTLEIETIEQVILFCRQMNPKIKILVRVKYLSDVSLMEKQQVQYVCCEKESGKAFKELLLSINSEDTVRII
ncbi:MAG: cation:proton antiporter, partial [Verrucomicrobia bacterium]|nr:cation:proton antiporter [Verrucomicrobiota bacterium]